jgi:hypothetical protein
MIKTDRFGLSIPMVPALGLVRGETHQNDLKDTVPPDIQRKPGMSLRSTSEGIFLSIFNPLRLPCFKEVPLNSVERVH